MEMDHSRADEKRGGHILPSSVLSSLSVTLSCWCVLFFSSDSSSLVCERLHCLKTIITLLSDPWIAPV